MLGCSRCCDDKPFDVITGGRPLTCDGFEYAIAARFTRGDRRIGGAAERDIFHNADISDEDGARGLRDHLS